MIQIIDNGAGADEIAGIIRENTTVAKPDEADFKCRAFVLSDGDINNQPENAKILEKCDCPVLGIGAGYIFLGTAAGADLAELKSGSLRISIKKPCPITTDMKKTISVVSNSPYGLDDLPPNFAAVGSSKGYDYEVIQDSENPFFGVRFNPEAGGDGVKIIRNFAKFVEMWERYHK